MIHPYDSYALMIVGGCFGVYTVWHVILYYRDKLLGHVTKDTND